MTFTTPDWICRTRLASLAIASALSCVLLLGWPYTTPAPAQDPAPPQPGAPPGDKEINEEFDFLTRAIASSTEIISDQSIQRAEKFVDSLPIERTRDRLKQWQTHASDIVRRTGMLLLDGLQASETWRPTLERLGPAGMPTIVGATFVRITLGDKGGAPITDYAWRIGDDADGTDHRLVHVIGLDLLPRDIRVQRRAGPGVLPAFDAADFRTIARSLAVDLIGGKLPGAANPQYRIERCTAEATRVMRLAWMAWQNGYRVLTGELMQALDRLVAVVSPTDPADTRGPAFVRLHAARLLFRLALDSWADGAPVDDTRARIRAIRQTLEPAALQFTLADMLDALAAIDDAPAVGERPVQPDPAGPPEASELFDRALAMWHISRLTQLTGNLGEAPWPDTLGLFSPAPTNDDVRALWRMQLHAVPALLAGLTDRRPTRMLLQWNGLPWPVRVGDICYALLRRISGRLLMPAERMLPPVPCLDHDEHIALAAATAWRELLGKVDDRRFFALRIADGDNPDRLTIIDWYIALDQAEAFDMIRHLLDSRVANEIEPDLVHRLITGDMRDSVAWLAEYAEKARQPETHLLLARALFEQVQNPVGAASVWTDMEAGRFPADAAGVGERLDLLRAIGIAFPDSYPHADARVAALLANTAGALDDWQRLAILRYLSEPRATVPDEFRLAMLQSLDDQRVVGAGMPPSDVPDVVSGVLAPRWRDYVAAALARSLGAERMFQWNAPLATRDAAVGRILTLLRQVAPDVISDADVAARSTADTLPPVVPLSAADATPLLDAVLAADELDADATAAATAACLRAGAPLWNELARQIVAARASNRDRLVVLARLLAGVVRRVRVRVHAAPGTAADSLPLLDTVRTECATTLDALVGRPASPSLLRTVIGQLQMKNPDGRAVVQRADVRLVRLPHGAGTLLEVDITAGGRNAPYSLLRAAVAIDGELKERRSLQIGRGLPDADLLEMLLSDIDSALSAGFDGSASRLIEARLTVAPVANNAKR